MGDGHGCRCEGSAGFGRGVLLIAGCGGGEAAAPSVSAAGGAGTMVKGSDTDGLVPMDSGAALTAPTVILPVITEAYSPRTPLGGNGAANSATARCPAGAAISGGFTSDAPMGALVEVSKRDGSDGWTVSMRGDSAYQFQAIVYCLAG